MKETHRAETAEAAASGTVDREGVSRRWHSGYGQKLAESVSPECALSGIHKSGRKQLSDMYMRRRQVFKGAGAGHSW